MSKKRKQLVTIDEAVYTTSQHKKPCPDCPWARASLAGWLGGTPAVQWLEEVRGEVKIDCHTIIPAQCAGAAIFRSHICKLPRDKLLLVLPADREKVFSTPGEFTAHHEK